MRTQAEIVELIDKMFPNRVYFCADAPENQRYLVQFFRNPGMTLMTSAYGATEQEALDKGNSLYIAFLSKACKVDGRKARPKYPDTPEGRLEEVIDRLIEIFSVFMSEITSETLDT